MRHKSTFLTLLTLLVILVSIPLQVFAQDGGEPITLRMTWWGNEARTALYNQILDLYETQNPNIKIEREFTGDFAGYWDKLATQIAAGNSPDLVIMHLNYINEYVGRNALVNLTDYIDSGKIDLSNFSAGALNAGAVDGVPYMVTLGLTPRTLIYNSRLFEEAGVALPEPEWTWSDFQEKAAAISAGSDGEVWGAADQGSSEVAFFIFLGQRGQSFFKGDVLGFDRQDLLDWWGMWEAMRASDAIPPADFTSELATSIQADSALARGQVAMFISPGNQFAIFQDSSEDELDMMTIPRSEEPGAVPYNYAGGAFMAISSQSQYPDQVADLINWFVNDEEVQRIYNGEHGPPGSTVIVDMLSPNLSRADQKLYAFHAMVADYVQPQPSSPPQSREVQVALERIYTELSFGQRTLEDAVDAFFEEADFILN